MWSDSFLSCVITQQGLTLRRWVAQCPLCLTYYLSQYDEERWMFWARNTSPASLSWHVTAGFIKWQQFVHTYNFIQRGHEPDFPVPKLIKPRKPFFPDMAINIYKTVTQVKYALRMHATLYQGSLEFTADYHSHHLIASLVFVLFGQVLESE